MAKRGRSINRPGPRRSERSRLLVVTEGEVTEVQYLQGLAQYFRNSGAEVRGVSFKGIGRDPQKVVAAAIGIAAGEDFDEVWVVVDVDEHTTLETALADGARSSIPVVVSNPCFEIWLLWHYDDCFAHQSREDLKRKLSKHGHDGKHVPSGFPYSAWENAERRAGRSRVEHGAIGENPSSAMPQLVAAMGRS